MARVTKTGSLSHSAQARLIPHLQLRLKQQLLMSKDKMEMAHVEIPTSKVLLHHRNLDACTPPASRDSPPLLLSLAQARLNFGFGPAHPAHPTGRTVAEPKSRVLPITRA